MAATYRAVEFYSGIGGMHYALKLCGTAVEVVAAIDINTTANEVYTHNFPDIVLLNRNIEGIRQDEFTKLNADIFTMSPPCQPFTRQGHQKASDDPRTKSFLHIMKMIRNLPKPPSYILMENVKGFEVSETREEYIKTLNEANYVFQEFLLSPSQFGVPNSRLRYFLMAVHKPLKLPFIQTDTIIECFPTSLDSNTTNKQCSSLNSDNPRLNCPVCNKQELLLSAKSTSNNSLPQQEKKLPNTVDCRALTERSACSNQSDTCDKRDTENTVSNRDKHTRNSNPNIDMPASSSGKECYSKTNLQVRIQDSDKNNTKGCYQACNRIATIDDFLQKDKQNFEEFLVPKNILKKKVLLMDIVEKKCNHSCCFTKGYGHYIEGTGSVLQKSSVNSSAIFQKYSEAISEEEKIKLLAPLGLRYFTPREIANILYFPEEFDFPTAVTEKQKYRLLGNSLNVLVVSELMKIMFVATNK